MPEGYVTSFVQLFEAPNNRQQINAIRIPLIQRDYAQGRIDRDAGVIRDRFLNALHRAVVEDQPIGLDFVYGEIVKGRFEPLDGQQRLTTLFLLHWYIASRAGRLDPNARWTSFRYETRLSAERFGELLAENAYSGPGAVSAWVRNQSWYLYTWNYDPTVQSMLTMLDAIHRRFDGAEFVSAWDRLTCKQRPAISFHVLPMPASHGNALYIKMNSRGKPLTIFENFKAHMERVVRGLPSAKALAGRMDIAWPNIFWPYAGDAKLVDSQMLSYLECLMEMLFWHDGRQASGSAFEQVENLFDPADPKAQERLSWLIEAIDIWEFPQTSEAKPVAKYFASYLESEATGTPDRLPIYRSETDLFGQCCANYARGGKSRKFGWPETLLLYAFIVHRTRETPDFPRRLRILRNLIEASENELRLELMPALMADVEKLVSTSDLKEAVTLTALNAAQRAHERKKIDVLENQPALAHSMARLEDNHLLRGNLFAFDLDCDLATFASRQAMFDQCFNDKALWPDLAAGLLAIGDYSRLKGARFYFGSVQETSWREVFTGGNYQDVKATRRILTGMLDRLVQSPDDPEIAIDDIVSAYLATDRASTGHDWREYMVRYDVMRSGKSGIYVSPDRKLGYCLCMLDKTQLNSNYRDPVLSAIVEKAAAPANRIHDKFFGGAQNPRPMRLQKSGMTIECVPEGFRVKPPTEASQLDAYREVATRQGVDEGSLIIAKMPDGVTDQVDRIEVGGQLLADLIAVGL